MTTTQTNRVAFSTSRLLDFCSEKELTAQIGHARHTWPLVVLKELVDNGLDACEEAHIAPEVTITVDATGITVAGNGPGIPESVIKSVLNFGVRVSSREAYVAPDRGAQGNALKTILAMPYVLDGESGRVVVSAGGVDYVIDFAVDHIRQEPKITLEQQASFARKGTSVRVEWPVSACSILEDAKAHFLQIADDYTWLNPHLTLRVDWFGEHSVVDATAPAWPKWGPSDPTSPHWYDLASMERLICGYIAYDQDAARERLVREFIGEFKGLASSAKRKAIADELGLSRASLSSLAEGGELNGAQVEELLKAMKHRSNPVKPAGLGVVGKEHLQQRFIDAGCEMESFDYRKLEGTTDGLPWIVEAAFGWCPQAQDRRLVTGVNWSPGIVNPFRELGRYGQSLDTLLSQARADRDEPVILLLHVTCPRVQFTDRGKSAVVIGDSSMGADTIIAAVNGVTKKWTKQRKAEERQASAAMNRWDAMSARRRITVKEACYEYMETAYLKASANGTYPATARQVMYAIRGTVQELTGKRLDDSYFTQTLLPDYMREYGKDEAWNVVYDDRGHFQEPHSGHAIGLGTLSVRQYLAQVGDPTISDAEVKFPEITTHGPRARYGAVLFIEKEGFMPLFDRVKLAERYDLAIMSTKGVSNTASRRLIDTLEGLCGVPILVLHDFDIAGFLILATLQRDTRRYSFNNGGDLNVIDLGLRLDDVVEYYLDYEDAYEKKNATTQRRNLASNGATPKEIEVLLSRRVELNAFSSDQIVEWIEAKLEENGVRKVVPTDRYLADVYRRFLATEYLKEHTQAIQKAAEAYAQSAIVPGDLGAKIREGLDGDRELSWDVMMGEIVREVSR